MTWQLPLILKTFVRCGKVCASKFGRCFSGELSDMRIRKSRRSSPLVSVRNTKRYLPNLWFPPTGKYRKFVRRLGGHLRDRILAFSFPPPTQRDPRAIKGTTNSRRISPRASPFFSPRLLRNYYFIGDLRVFVLRTVTDPKIQPSKCQDRVSCRGSLKRS